MYNKDEKAIIFMSQFDFMTAKKFSEFFSLLKSPKNLFELDEKQLFMFKDVIGNHYEKFVETLKNFDENKFYDNLENRGIKVSTIASENYPFKLRKLENPPYCLYYVGNINLVNNTCVSVVGSRNPTSYGKIVTEKLVKEMVEKDIVTVSGLALGVDKIAHETTLNNKGKTIAVLGSGFDNIFPPINVNLARDIAKSGLVITEYYLNVKATRYTFPIRNRIIACLSNAILITEAKKGSGSLYTQEYGEQVGIDTMCVPGNITSELSYSTNNLIKAGAIMVTSANDIFEKLGLQYQNKTREKKQKQLQLSIEQQTIYEALKNEELDFETLMQKTGFSTQTLNISLTSMEIAGIIKKMAGNTYILC